MDDGMTARLDDKEQCVAVCCSVLQCVAARLDDKEQCVAVCCSVLQLV